MSLACASPLPAQTFFGTFGTESATGVERGSTALVLPVEEPTAFLTFDSFGSREAGPAVASVGYAFPDVMFAGDQLDMVAVVAGPGREQATELAAAGVGYRFAISPDATAYLTASFARLTPQGPLTADAGIEGYSRQVALGLRRETDPGPTVRLSQVFELRVRDAGATAFGTSFLDERIQSVFIGFRRSAGLPFGRQSRLGAAISAGRADYGVAALPGALASYPGASDLFLRLSASAEGSLPLFGPWVINAGLVGQMSDDSLPVSQKCGFGTNAYSRGFDLSEVLGDRCVAGRAELAANLSRPGAGSGLWVQAFAGVDGGHVRQNANDLRAATRQDWSSVNLGVRALASNWVAEISFSDVLESPASAATAEGDERLWVRAAIRF